MAGGPCPPAGVLPLLLTHLSCERILVASEWSGHWTPICYTLSVVSRRVACRQVGKGRRAYDKVVSAVQQWKHMDLGWTTVHADCPVKGNLVCVLPHIVVPWMKLPLQVTFVDQSMCRKDQKRGWTGDSSISRHIPGLVLNSLQHLLSAHLSYVRQQANLSQCEPC